MSLDRPSQHGAAGAKLAHCAAALLQVVSVSMRSVSTVVNGSRLIFALLVAVRHGALSPSSAGPARGQALARRARRDRDFEGPARDLRRECVISRGRPRAGSGQPGGRCAQHHGPLRRLGRACAHSGSFGVIGTVSMASRQPRVVSRAGLGGDRAVHCLMVLRHPPDRPCFAALARSTREPCSREAVAGSCQDHCSTRRGAQTAPGGASFAASGRDLRRAASSCDRDEGRRLRSTRASRTNVCACRLAAVALQRRTRASAQWALRIAARRF